MWTDKIWMTLESSSYCNLLCERCSQNNSSLRDKSFLSRGLVKKIINEIVHEKIKLSSLNPFFRGEPFLNPEFPWFMDYISGKLREFLFIDNIVIHTNGMLLSGENMRSVLDISDQSVLPHPNDLFISLDSVDDLIYSKIRKGGCLQTVLENIRRFLDARERRGQFGPNIIFQMIVQPLNKGQLVKFYEEIRDIHSGISSKPLNVMYTIENEPWRISSDTVYFRSLEGAPWEREKNNRLIRQELKILQKNGIIQYDGSWRKDEK